MFMSCTWSAPRRAGKKSRTASSGALSDCFDREIMTMIAFSTQFALITLTVALLIAVVRLVKGPTLPDRVVAMDLVGVLVVGLIVVLAASTGVRAALDAAIVIALIAFVSTVAYGTYVERGHPE